MKARWRPVVRMLSRQTNICEVCVVYFSLRNLLDEAPTSPSLLRFRAVLPARHATPHRRVKTCVALPPPCTCKGEGLEFLLVLLLHRSSVFRRWHLLARPVHIALLCRPRSARSIGSGGRITAESLLETCAERHGGGVEWMGCTINFIG
jgi:hypothetical protein